MPWRFMDCAAVRSFSSSFRLLSPSESRFRKCNRLLRCLVFVSVLLIGASFAHAQYDYLPQVGIKNFATYQYSDVDSVDLSTGNVNLHIPLVGFPQKDDKLRLNFMIRYNEPQWMTVIGAVQPLPDGGYTTHGFWRLGAIRKRSLIGS